MDAVGRGVVTWLEWNGSAYEARALGQQANGAWSDGLVLSGPGHSALTPQVVAGGAGVATVAWVEVNGGAGTLLARTRLADGSWGPTATLGANHFSIYVNGSLGADSSGNVVAAWEGPGAHTVAKVTALDSAGPRLGTPVVPAQVYAGKQAAFSVAQPDDAWSQTAQVAWSFGPGPTSTGLDATHTWQKGGLHPVTVSATDTLGNVTTRSVSVQVIGRPRLSKLRLSRAELDPGGQTKLSFRLSTDAKVVAKVHAPDGRVLVKLSGKTLGAGRHALVLRTTMKGVHLRSAPTASRSWRPTRLERARPRRSG